MDKSYQDHLFYGYQSPNMDLILPSSSSATSSNANSSNNNIFSSLYQVNNIQALEQAQRKANTFNEILSNQGFDYNSISCLRTPTVPPTASYETNELFNAAAAAAYNAVSVSFAGKLASKF
jgi:hypothetical protein